MADMRRCNYCHRVDSNLRRCSRCYIVYYCSKGCQTMDWLGHKTSCSKTAFDIKAKMKSDYSDIEKNTNVEGNLPSGNTDNTLEADSDSFEGNDKVMKNSIDKDKNKETPPNIQSFSGVHKTQYDNFTESHDKTKSATGPYRGGAEPSSEASSDVEPSDWNSMRSEPFRGTSRRSEPFSWSSRRSEPFSGTFMRSEPFSRTSRRSEPFSGTSGIKSDKSYRGANNEKKSATKLCANCSKEGCSQKCSRCKETFYCSQECQRKDWLSHKRTCIKKLTEEEEKIKKLHEKMTENREKHRRFRNENVFTTYIKTFQGPEERWWEMLTLEQALYMAKRPGASLPKAVRLARIFFPLYNIVTDFDDIPTESMFPFFSSMVPSRDVYVLVAFMYRYHEHVMRHGVYLKDAHDKESKVEFYFDHLGDNPYPFFTYSQVKPGGYICLVDPVMHRFGDGSVGIRINNPEEVKVLDIEMVMK